MTDAEIVCGFMEPKPRLPNGYSHLAWSPMGWWVLGATCGGGMAWFVARNGCRVGLDALHEVEARLTEAQWERYCATFAVNNLPEPTVNPGYMETVAWDKAHLHATAEQKLAALANVLNGAANDPR